MERVFLSILNMSMTASYVLAAILILRLLIRSLPKWISYSLWTIVLFRLVCPFSISSSFSILGAILKPATNPGRIEYIPANIGTMVIPQVDLGMPAINGSTI